MDERSDLSTAAAGWYPDPLGRCEFRWFNGLRWTADVSVDGRRFVDDLDAPGRAPVGPGALGPAAAPLGMPVRLSRTLAMLAMIFGLAGLVIAWVPFVFVVGGLGGIAAVVLGIVALRRIGANRASGRGMAVTGIVAGVAALAMCVVGFVFTRAVVREITEFTDPGPVDAQVTTCTAEGVTVTMTGTIDNRDDRSHDYVLDIRIDDRTGYQTTAHVAVDDVAAGEHRAWSSDRFVRGLDAGTVACKLGEVNGPYPFDLNQP